ncbi:MAG: OadG family protein [Clostridia bacterium]|nr:OadG family protein [Clostridia bacterium]
MLALTLNVNYPDWFVCALGVGTVFIGLVAIIILCKILGALCQINTKLPEKSKEQVSSVTPVTPVKAAGPVEIPNRRETIAAISVAIAEDLGTDVSAIRIVSIEKA